MRARLVERLNVSAPTVSETVARLEREGLLTLDESRVVHLTDRGRHAATAVMRRHRLAERLLVDVLKVPWHQVHEEAHRLEHAISDNLERHLVAALGDPATCPHGNPIPGSSRRADATPQVPITALSAGERGVVRRIDEQLEARPHDLLLVEQAGLLPGRRLVRRSAAAVDEIVVSTDAGEFPVPGRVAELVYVAR